MSQTNRPIIPGADRLVGLPHRADLILEGGKRAAGIYVREGDQTIGLELALWVDAESGIVRAASAPISPLESVDGGLTEALTALVAALAGPFPMLPVGGEVELVPTTGRGKRDQEARRSLAEPALPGLVRVNDEALAAAARDMLAPLGRPGRVRRRPAHLGGCLWLHGQWSGWRPRGGTARAVCLGDRRGAGAAPVQGSGGLCAPRPLGVCAR